RCATAWRSSRSPATRSRRKSRSPGAISCPDSSRTTASRTRTSSSRTNPCRSFRIATRARPACAISSATWPPSCASAPRGRPKAEGAWVIDNEKVEEILGIPRYAVEEAEVQPEVGVVTGMAWTSTGGDLMTIEALRMHGTGRLVVTGQLGDVMRESVDAAYSYVRSRAAQLGIEDREFKELDLHIHLPAGAIPKDGPSAGITLTLAIASVLSRRPVRRDVAMT